MPFIIEGMRQDAAQVATADSSASAVPPAKSVDSVAILYATPFLMGIENLIGLLIIAFALYEAWKLNRKTELKITGPYRVAGAAGGGAAPA